MSEYKRHIEKYLTHSYQYHSCLISRSDWGDKEAAEKFLEKYWLSLAEYELRWKQIQSQIFISQNLMPDIIISTTYEMLALRGGCLFVEEEFKKLQECFVGVGDRHFLVIENTFGGKSEEEEPSFRMKFPADISWGELTSGNFISAMIVDYFNKEFFVFGETTDWGMYSASCYRKPLNIVGFQPKHAPLFREKLKVPEKERLEIITKWIPPAYQIFIR